MKTNKILEEAGLSQNEAKVYTALSKLGEANANQVADASNIHRSNVYDTLQRLVVKGLISYIEKNNSKHYKITDHKLLLGILEDKKKQLENAIENMSRNVPLVNSSSAEIIEGLNGFCSLLDNFLNYNEDILAYGIPKIAPDKMKYFITGFHKRRLAKKIKMYHIYNFNAQKRIRFLNKMNLTYATYLPEEFDSKVSTNICGYELVLTLWAEKVWSIRVKNPDIASSYKKYFHLLWEKATSSSQGPSL